MKAKNQRFWRQGMEQMQRNKAVKPKVKICGITTMKEADWLNAAGADYAGFVVSGDNHMDEFNLAGTTTVAEIKDGKVSVFEVTPEQFGLTHCELSDLQGGEGTENAKITKAILDGTEQGAKRDVVLLNAGATLYIGGLADSIADGIKQAAESIDSGKAKAVLENMVRMSN